MLSYLLTPISLIVAYKFKEDISTYLTEYMNFFKMASAQGCRSFFHLHLKSVGIIYSIMKDEVKLHKDIGVAVNVAKNTYRVPYIIGKRRYNFYVRSRKGPSDILKIADENGNDIELEIAGPNYDFHNSPIFYPELAGHRELSVRYADDSEKTYKDTEIILKDTPSI
jgi:hypothetical protein